MFLKPFKDKSNQKYVDKLLAARKAAVDSRKVKTIAVLMHMDEFDDFEGFRAYFKELELNSPKHKIVAFSPDGAFESSPWETYFGPKDFGWKGKINHVDLEAFVLEEYDVLVSYYKSNNLFLKLITAESKANLKVGLSRDDERLFDLIINVEPKDFGTFKKEFKKYLKILKKL